jgi:hypothetical protein
MRMAPTGLALNMARTSIKGLNKPVQHIRIS